MLDLILIFGGVLLLLVVCYMLLAGNPHRRAAKKRIARMHNRKGAIAITPESMLLRKQAVQEKKLVSMLTRPLPKLITLAAKLEQAEYKISARQFMLRCIMCALVITIIIAFVFKKPILLGISAGIILGVWLPFKYLGRVIGKKKRMFLHYFPNALDLIVRGLRSGLPVSESITLVAKEVQAPVGPVFANMANTMKLGVSLEKALVETARKLDMTEFNFFTTSIILQRETGGNLGEIINNLSEVLRSRFLMRMKIKALSSEANASAIIVGSIPFFIISAIMIMSPGYMDVLADDRRGNIAAGIATCMMVTGITVMRKMTRFEI